MKSGWQLPRSEDGNNIIFERLAYWATYQPASPFLIDAATDATLTYEQAFRAVQMVQHAWGSEPRRIWLAFDAGIPSALVWLSALTGGHMLVPSASESTVLEVRQIAQQFPPDIICCEAEREQFAAEFPQARVLRRADVTPHPLTPSPSVKMGSRVVRPLRVARCQGNYDGTDFTLLSERLPIITEGNEEPGQTSSPLPIRQNGEGAGGGAVCLRTSGSTGTPKWIVLDAARIAWTAEQVRRAHRLTRLDRGLAVLPFHHVNAPVVSLCATLLAGGSVVIAPRFSLSRFWGWCEHYATTWASVVPTIIALLLTTEKPDFLPGALRFIRTASAHLSPAHMEAFERRFGLPVIETYGLTEAASQVCANPLPPELHLPGSVGKPTGVDLRICAPHEPELRDVAAGEVGEVCIAGPGVIRAYWEDADAEAFHDGWFRTGDLGYRDAGGYLYLTGRLRDTIIRGGENIAPAEIEDVLLTHPDIREVAVVGAPDELYGEQVVAYIVLHEARAPLAERNLHNFCEERLSKTKVPARFITIEGLPRTHAGKPDRQRLRYMALSAHITTIGNSADLGARS